MITIIIPTMNRSAFLTRLLNYYAETGYKHRIIIGDSSDAFHVERIKEVIGKLQGKLKIVYHEYPNLSDSACVKQLIQAVSTPYAVFVADDDFLVTEALERSVRFLEKHPGYNAAHGVGILFSLEGSGPYGNIAAISKYKQPLIEEGTASQRLLNHLNSYSVTLFSVHRTDSWKKMYKNVDLPDKSFAAELLPCCLSVVQGKIKELDCLYLVRQGHDCRYLLPDSYDWITSPNWFPSYQIFSRSLAGELVKRDKITLEEAQEIVKQAFWAYLSKGFSSTYQQRYEKKVKGKKFLKKMLKNFPIVNDSLLPLWRFARSKLDRSDFSFPALLNPSSPYHADFMQVYRAITGPIREKKKDIKY